MSVIGPFNREQWETLKMLRASIRYMKSLGRSEYRPAIEKEQCIYRRILDAA